LNVAFPPPWTIEETKRSHAFFEPETTSATACALERTSAYDVTSSNERTAADAIAGPYQLTTPH